MLEPVGTKPSPRQRQRPVKGRGLGRIYQRGRTWWVQYHFRGRLFRETTGSADQSAAVKLLKRRLGEMGRGVLVGPSVERTTFEDLAKLLISDYKVNGRKSLDRAERSVGLLRTFFGLSRAVDITPNRVAAYVSSRLGQVKPA